MWLYYSIFFLSGPPGRAFFFIIDHPMDGWFSLLPFIIERQAAESITTSYFVLRTKFFHLPFFIKKKGRWNQAKKGKKYRKNKEKRKYKKEEAVIM
jgi:hypothetical protein